MCNNIVVTIKMYKNLKKIYIFFIFERILEGDHLVTLSEFPGRMGESNKTAHFSDSARREESLPHWSRVRSTLEAAAEGFPDRGSSVCDS